MIKSLKCTMLCHKGHSVNIVGMCCDQLWYKQMCLSGWKGPPTQLKIAQVVTAAGWTKKREMGKPWSGPVVSEFWLVALYYAKVA